MTEPNQENHPVEPVDAATVVLVKPGDPGFEVYLMRRTRKRGAFKGAYVFPGGLVEDRDRDPALSGRAVLPQNGASLEAVLGETGRSSVFALSIYAAAVRETFEESGVLLADDEVTGRSFRPAPEAGAALDEARKRLAEAEIGLADLAGSLNVRFRLDSLLPFDRWITPQIEPKRFDTRFFLAAMPEDQEGIPDCRELKEGLWISPARALEAHAQGRMHLFPPTFLTLLSLSRRGSVEEALEAARNRRFHPVLPQPFRGGGQVGILLPHDPDYRIPEYKRPAGGKRPSRVVLGEKGWEPAWAGGRA